MLKKANKLKIVKSDRIMCFDVDRTLILETYASEDWSKMPLDAAEYYCSDAEVFILPAINNIHLLLKFASQGYYIIVWSRTGAQWCQEVVDTLDLGYYVDEIMTKPLYYVDDRPADKWMNRIYVPEPGYEHFDNDETLDKERKC